MDVNLASVGARVRVARTASLNRSDLPVLHRDDGAQPLHERPLAERTGLIGHKPEA